MVQIPRIGQEVIVDFLEGDPDQPIITGSVFNAKNMPPFKLPDSRMIAGIKTASYPGSKGFNQLTFDDTHGKELMRVHSQKNQTITVGHDRSLTVNNDEKVHIIGNRTENVDAHEKIIIKSGRDESVESGEKITVTGGRTEDVTGKEEVKITGDRAIEVSGKNGLKAGSRVVHVLGTDNFTGDGATTWHSKGALKITSDASIVIAVGESSGIEITASGIKIITTNLELSGSAKVETSGGMIKSSATGTHDITGALVKIN
jgi:type VI secretion system secreted protein VgrG